MNTANWKEALAKMFTASLVAAAIAVAVPSKAEAQVSFGVRFGGPVYVAPPYRRPVYVAPAPVYAYGYSGRDFKHYAWARHEGWNHRERWSR